MLKIFYFIILIALTSILIPQAAAQSSRFFGLPDVSTIESEESTRKEIDRIEKLAPSKSPALNQESLNEAKGIIQVLRSMPDELAEIEKVSIDAAKKRSADGMSALAKAIPTCNRKAISENQLVVKRQFEGLSGNGSRGIRIGLRSSQTLSEADETTIREVGQFLELGAELICKQYPDAGSISTISAQVDQSLTILGKQVADSLKGLREQAPRAKKLADAWEKYRDTLLKSIEEQSAPANKVADQLAWIIAIFCIFGILMFLALKVFDTDVQLELVASGQVIQFSTVMVLLIVVCVLGMSQFLKENTLGTLLGGIGGYVLSQGVGRAASRATSREIQAQNTARNSQSTGG